MFPCFIPGLSACTYTSWVICPAVAFGSSMLLTESRSVNMVSNWLVIVKKETILCGGWGAVGDRFTLQQNTNCSHLFIQKHSPSCLKKPKGRVYQKQTALNQNIHVFMKVYTFANRVVCYPVSQSLTEYHQKQGNTASHKVFLIESTPQLSCNIQTS